MPAYHRKFQLVLIDVNGVRSLAFNTTINAFDVTASASLGTLTSDDYGNIAEGTLGGLAGDVVEFSHSTYPGTYRQTLAATQDDAYTMAENVEQVFILRNLFTTTNAPTKGIIIAEDLDDPTAKPFVLGTVEAGTVNRIPYQTSVTKNLRFSLVGQDTTGQLSVVDTSKSEQIDVTIPSINSSPTLLFEHFEDVPTQTTSPEALYVDTIDAGIWAVNGDTIKTKSTIIFTPNSNTKNVLYDVAGTNVITESLTENNTKATIEVEAMRESASILRVAVTLVAGNAGARPPEYLQITGLDLNGTAYDMVLGGDTPTVKGDMTAVMSFGELWKGTGETLLTSEDLSFDLADEAGTTSLTA